MADTLKPKADPEAQLRASGFTPTDRGDARVGRTGLAPQGEVPTDAVMPSVRSTSATSGRRPTNKPVEDSDDYDELPKDGVRI
jgi:hypothetical protein